MYRAAAFDTGQDIAALVKRGSSVSFLTRPNGMPIRCAVRFGNFDTFLELLKHLTPSFIEEKDVRGWTSLHEAASVGNLSILQLVLDHGADPHATSIATSYIAPRVLENRRLTPADVARSKGDDACKIYIEALKTAGFEITVQEKFDDDGEGDVSWPAESIGKEGKE